MVIHRRLLWVPIHDMKVRFLLFVVSTALCSELQAVAKPPDQD